MVARVQLQDLFPLAPDDVGKIVVATGTVVGVVIPAGFFLRTDGGHVLFVQTAVPVAPGATVQVVGPLQKATVAVFDGWKTNALGGKIQPDWDLEDLWYVDATAVTVT